MLHHISDATNCICRLYYNANLKDNSYPYSRRGIRRKKTYPLKMESFMNITITRNTKEAFYLDMINKDGLWKEATDKASVG